MKTVCERYQLTPHIIGRGSYSQVVKGIDIWDNREVAVKCIDWNQLKKHAEYRKIKESVQKEIECMRQISCRHIVSFFDVDHIRDPYEDITYIVMEYCAGGDLSDYIKKKKELDERFHQREIVKILYCIAEGFLTLRTKRLVHRDIKPANLFLTKESLTWSDIKIGDFTFAKNEMDLTQTVCGSPLYMAPEIVLRKKYNEKADLWSIGVILFQIIYGRTPIAAASFPELITKIKNKDIWTGSSEPPSHISSELHQLIKRIVVLDPAQRIGFTEFFEQVRIIIKVTYKPHEPAQAIAIPSSTHSPSLSSYAGSYGAQDEKNIIISPRDVVALGYVMLRPPRTDPFINMTYTEPKARPRPRTVPPLSATALPSIEEAESEFVVLNRDLPEKYINDINAVSEIAKVLINRNDSSTPLAIYILLLRIVKARIENETKETSCYNMLVDLYHSLLSQAKVVGRTVRESILITGEEYINVHMYLFNVALTCRQEDPSNRWKLPFINIKNQTELLKAAYSILTVLEMDNTFEKMSDVLRMKSQISDLLGIF